MDFERMRETNRIAIKFDTNGKIVIRKENMDNHDLYLVDFSSNTKIEGVSLGSDALVFLDSMNVNKDNITLSAYVRTNVCEKEVYFVNGSGYIDTMYSIFIKEPEEDDKEFDISISIQNVEKIIPDMDMLNSMIKEGIIKDDEGNLGMYGIYAPKIRVIRR